LTHIAAGTIAGKRTIALTWPFVTFVANSTHDRSSCIRTTSSASAGPEHRHHGRGSNLIEELRVEVELPRDRLGRREPRRRAPRGVLQARAVGRPGVEADDARAVRHRPPDERRNFLGDHIARRDIHRRTRPQRRGRRERLRLQSHLDAHADRVGHAAQVRRAPVLIDGHVTLETIALMTARSS
jgi:hypothetical protein